MVAMVLTRKSTTTVPAGNRRGGGGGRGRRPRGRRICGRRWAASLLLPTIIVVVVNLVIVVIRLFVGKAVCRARKRLPGASIVLGPRMTKPARTGKPIRPRRILRSGLPYLVSGRIGDWGRAGRAGLRPCPARAFGIARRAPRRERAMYGKSGARGLAGHLWRAVAGARPGRGSRTHRWGQSRQRRHLGACCISYILV